MTPGVLHRSWWLVFGGLVEYFGELCSRVVLLPQLHCSSVRSDVTPDRPQSACTPIEPQTSSPYGWWAVRCGA